MKFSCNQCEMEEIFDNSDEEEEQYTHTPHLYPIFQYGVLGTLFSCAEFEHLVDFVSVKPSNETKNVFENAADVMHGMDTWVLVTILIGELF